MRTYQMCYQGDLILVILVWLFMITVAAGLSVVLILLIWQDIITRKKTTDE